MGLIAPDVVVYLDVPPEVVSRILYITIFFPHPICHLILNVIQVYLPFSVSLISCSE